MPRNVGTLRNQKKPKGTDFPLSLQQELTQPSVYSSLMLKLNVTIRMAEQKQVPPPKASTVYSVTCDCHLWLGPVSQ